MRYGFVILGITFLHFSAALGLCQTTLTGDHIITGDVEVGTGATPADLTIQNGKVGIGTTTLTAPLNIKGTDTGFTPNFIIKDASDHVLLTLYNRGFLAVTGYNNNTVLSLSTATGGNNGALMRIQTAGDGSGGSGNNWLYIGATANTPQSRLHFLNESADASIPMMVINSNLYGGNGRVGIGTTNPSAKLDVRGGMNVTGSITMERQGDILMGEFGNP